ncbi:hypothetical protein [Paraburkholderia dinghuensis]|uniref:Replication-relaxation n=1 Tax=Paraburkholderia dinghuensis TaxID=2305225 RepID=A0A3N6M819_9BURK|nr:hypothetical protein [Paraburkholderia dinghuensis]RQG99833.1 hypothetical protein D1Y85_26030 [Paraburkholderia dinghuensis]
MAKLDGRLTANRNEARVLRALHRFGWLRTRDIAVLIWQRWLNRPTDGPTFARVVASASGIRMAQRTMRRMHERRLVLRAMAPDGSVIYALAEGGARRLRDAGVTAVSGKDAVRDFSAAYYRHRVIANEVAIGAIVAGYRVSTEREIAQGRWLGGLDGIAGKRADVVLLSGRAIWWVEVERSRKNASDYRKLLTWLKIVADDLSITTRPYGVDGLRWQAIVFICTAAFRDRLRRDLQAAGVPVDALGATLRFETSLYKLQAMQFA